MRNLVFITLLVLGSSHEILLAQRIQLYTSQYEGEVINDTIPNGLGKMYYTSGEVLEGVFANGIIHGKAKIKYEGNIATGFFHVGDLSDAEVIVNQKTTSGTSKIKYIGTVVLHRVEEMETFDFSFGNHLIEKTGNGDLEILYDTGDTLKYHGMFLHDVYHGHGLLNDTRNNFIYRGHFEHGEIEGAGEFHYSDGSIYRGYLVKGQYMGRGYFKYPEESKFNYYNGMWRNNEQHGRGTLKYKDGGSYVGEFLSGKPHGNGKRVFADGSFFEGTFKHGQPMKPLSTKYTGR